jgi:hypothetical protein
MEPISSSSSSSSKKKQIKTYFRFHPTSSRQFLEVITADPRLLGGL